MKAKLNLFAAVCCGLVAILSVLQADWFWTVRLWS
jgi:hypothetical protein